MKALTVQQPWADAMFWVDPKDVENRTQAWSYRGPLAIHAGARWSERGGHSRLVARAFVADRQAAGLRGEPQDMGRLLDSFEAVGIDKRLFTYGAIIGIVNLVDVHQAVGDDLAVCCSSPWGETSYAEHGGHTRREIVHLELANPRPLAVPIPCRGALGLWTPPTEVLERLEAVA